MNKLYQNEIFNRFDFFVFNNRLIFQKINFLSTLIPHLNQSTYIYITLKTHFKYQTNKNIKPVTIYLMICIKNLHYIVIFFLHYIFMPFRLDHTIKFRILNFSFTLFIYTYKIPHFFFFYIWKSLNYNNSPSNILYIYKIWTINQLNNPKIIHKYWISWIFLFTLSEPLFIALANSKPYPTNQVPIMDLLFVSQQQQ